MALYRSLVAAGGGAGKGVGGAVLGHVAGVAQKEGSQGLLGARVIEAAGHKLRNRHVVEAYHKVRGHDGGSVVARLLGAIDPHDGGAKLAHDAAEKVAGALVALNGKGAARNSRHESNLLLTA